MGKKKNDELPKSHFDVKELQDLFDNKTIPIATSATPILDGEIPNVKRTYTFRSSTVRKLMIYRTYR